MNSFDKSVAEILLKGGIGVIPTDTLYGIVGRADNPETVERIYKVRKRSPDKPFIILISSFEDLDKFSVEISEESKEYMEENNLWPGKVSIVFNIKNKNLDYLTRETKTLAFRFPEEESLQNLLKVTGPLVAPSANPEGEEPAKNIDEAKKYFGDLVDFYVDGGEQVGMPSTLIKFENNRPLVLREGVVKINETF